MTPEYIHLDIFDMANNQLVREIKTVYSMGFPYTDGDIFEDAEGDEYELILDSVQEHGGTAQQLIRIISAKSGKGKNLLEAQNNHNYRFYAQLTPETPIVTGGSRRRHLQSKSTPSQRRKIHTGPKGGKYYIKNGRKVYL